MIKIKKNFFLPNKSFLCLAIFAKKFFMKKFILLGAAGYIAPRHMKAIKETGNILIAAMDKNDSVGIIDSYFPNAHFFTEIERLERHVEKMRFNGEKIDYVSICTPNYLHDAHIRFALRQEANAICEKPLVLNPWNVDLLKKMEEYYGHKIYTILQLRHHPKIIELKNFVENNKSNKKYVIELIYITARGRWYFQSWKADISKSGGIATNIGIHFFDMLCWIFGKMQNSIVYKLDPDKASGFLELENAYVKWYLSLDFNDLPEQIRNAGKMSYREITIDGQTFEFSEGFTDLHTVTYQNILNGNGYGIDDAYESIRIVYTIRNSKPTSKEL